MDFYSSLNLHELDADAHAQLKDLTLSFEAHQETLKESAACVLISTHASMSAVSEAAVVIFILDEMDYERFATHIVKVQVRIELLRCSLLSCSFVSDSRLGARIVCGRRSDKQRTRAADWRSATRTEDIGDVVRIAVLVRDGRVRAEESTRALCSECTT